MKKPFDEALSESIRKLERGAEPEAVLRDYPEHAAELRPHVQVWSSLNGTEMGEPSRAGMARGLNRLTASLRETEPTLGGDQLIGSVSRSTGFTLRLLGATSVVAGLALGVAYFTGNFHMQFGEGAQATHTQACLDQVMGNLADPEDGHFDLSDLFALRDAILANTTAPKYDRDGNTVVDNFDLTVYTDELNSCFGIP